MTELSFQRLKMAIEADYFLLFFILLYFFLKQNKLDGAAFMGVGFDGRGEYSPESRKMSIVQRSCTRKSK